MDFVLVSPLVMFMVLALMQLAFVMHTRSVIACAAEEAVRVAASFNGNTGAGERRFRTLIGAQVPPDAVSTLTWTSTLDTLTLRVRGPLALFGGLGTVTMTIDASAYREAWP